MSRIVIVILIYHRHKSIDHVNLLGLIARSNVFPVRYEHYPSCVLKQKTGQWIMSRIVSYINIPSSQTCIYVFIYILVSASCRELLGTPHKNTVEFSAILYQYAYVLMGFRHMAKRFWNF
jgi:hypothetical protein